jgi:hypothetical protein
MPSVKLTDEFKAAISDLPMKEKDKLLYRLIAKDELLVEKLTYELINSQEESVEDRRHKLQQRMAQELDDYRFYSPGYLLLTLRSMSAQITRHLKVTKDKYGEVALNFFMLNYSLQLFGQQINEARSHKQRTLADYVLKRTKKLAKMLQGMHADLALDFEEDMMELLQHIERNRIMKNTMAHHQVDTKELRRLFDNY